MDLVYEDLDKLPTEDLACINEWLTEKVDALTQRLKAEPREDEEVRHGIHWCQISCSQPVQHADCT